MSDKPQHLNRVPKPSPELATLIDLVNEIPNHASSTRRMYEETSGPGAAWEGRFEAEIERLPPRVREHIGPPRNPGESFISPEAQARYNKLVQARAVLGFAGLQNAHAMLFPPGKAGPDRHRQNLAAYWRSFPTTSANLINATILARWSVTAKNELKVVTIPLIEELEDIDYLRIRWCSRCARIFFAARLQQSACPEPCAHILRTLRWREAYGGKYKQQRIKRADELDARTKAERQNKSPRKEGK
jgi:hypothetical protein